LAVKAGNERPNSAAQMGEYFFLFLTILFVVAVLVGEDFVLTLLYLFLGAYIVGRWWGQRSLRGVTVQRAFTRRAFLGEKIPVQLEVANTSLLPLAWLHVRESLPIELHSAGPFQQVATVGSKGRLHLEYLLECRKRGYYPIGPLDLSSGDVLGVAHTQRISFLPEYLTVYPRIVPLTSVKLPSHAPLGTLRHHQPVFEDPSRVLGKRDYVAGDSLRRIDWKSSATVGRLQVKLFEPSIALETAIFLNLNAFEYDLRSRFYASELAIVVAASLANWVTGARQSVGLVTNGADPLSDNQPPLPIPPRRGRAHLLRILENLARLQVAETFPIVQLLRQHSNNLSWGTTIILITNRIGDELFDALFQTRRSGLSAFLIQCGPTASYEQIRRKARYFGFPLYQVFDEKDLDLWRQ
jgi:uncharacterized protein (DUF58 family)